MLASPSWRAGRRGSGVRGPALFIPGSPLWPVPTRQPGRASRPTRNTLLGGMSGDISEHRITVKLEPHGLTSSPFLSLLQQKGMHPKLQVESVRLSRKLSEIVSHAARRWDKALHQLQDPAIEVYHTSGERICDETITIGALVEAAGGVTAAGEDVVKRLILRYDVRAALKAEGVSREAEVTPVASSATSAVDEDEEQERVQALSGRKRVLDMAYHPDESSARGAYSDARRTGGSMPPDGGQQQQPGRSNRGLEERIAAMRKACSAQVDEEVRERIQPVVDAFLHDKIDQQELGRCKQAIRQRVQTEHSGELSALDSAHAAYLASVVAQETARSALESTLSRMAIPGTRPATDPGSAGASAAVAAPPAGPPAAPASAPPPDPRSSTPTSELPSTPTLTSQALPHALTHKSALHTRLRPNFQASHSAPPMLRRVADVVPPYRSYSDPPAPPTAILHPGLLGPEVVRRNSDRGAFGRLRTLFDA